jgi:hypothetical protein
MRRCTKLQIDPLPGLFSRQVFGCLALSVLVALLLPCPYAAGAASEAGWDPVAPACPIEDNAISRLAPIQRTGGIATDSRILAAADADHWAEADAPEECLVTPGMIHPAAALQPLPSWFEHVRCGYDGGFVLAADRNLDLRASEWPFFLRINGWGQLRHTLLDSDGPNEDINQFQLIRGRLVFSGHAFTSDFGYFTQFDGRSSSGDDLRLLDYYLTYDLGHHLWDWRRGSLGFRTGKYKVPVTFARDLSARELELADRSVASTYFDVNRSLGGGLFGQTNTWPFPVHWEATLFNGLVTGGAETGSSGDLDTNFAYGMRLYAFPFGDWGSGSLADFDHHDRLANRIGAGFASSAIERSGTTEFSAIRVVDSGIPLSNLLPPDVESYTVRIYCVDSSWKYRGWSFTSEYYLRSIDGFQGATIPDLFDHGFWMQLGKFLVREKLQVLARWSRINGNSGTLGQDDQSAEEIAGGFVWYFRGQHAKLTFDATYLDGAPINSSALGITPGQMGWLYRTQIQFAF